MSNNKFEIVDRRRQNKEETAAPEIISAPATENTGDKSTWKDIPKNPAYMVVLA